MRFRPRLLAVGKRPPNTRLFLSTDPQLGEDGTMLVLEVKGQDSAQNQTKRKFLDEGVTAVNQHGGFGTWRWAVARTAGEVASVIPARG